MNLDKGATRRLSRWAEQYECDHGGIVVPGRVERREAREVRHGLERRCRKMGGSPRAGQRPCLGGRIGSGHRRIRNMRLVDVIEQLAGLIELAGLAEQLASLVGIASLAGIVSRWCTRDRRRFRKLKPMVEAYRRDVDNTNTGRCTPAEDWAPVHRWNDLLRGLMELKVDFVLQARNDQDFAILIDCMERGDLRAARKKFPVGGNRPDLDFSLPPVAHSTAALWETFGMGERAVKASEAAKRRLDTPSR